MKDFFKGILETISDILGEIETGFLRGIGFILSLLFVGLIIFMIISSMNMS